MPEPKRANVLRFGVFEVDLGSGELRKSGSRIRLQEQPFRILTALLEHPGEVVTREELRRRIWPEESFGDFDHAVNVAVGKLRTALNDSAEVPRLIETLPRRGYRYIGPTNVPMMAAEQLPSNTPEESQHREKKVVLVVLPFDNLSGNPEQEYFSDGMTEEMIAQLGRVQPGQLSVIARPSSMHYKGTGKRIDEIGRELRVNYILAGSVRRVGDRVRITAQLAQVHDQTQIWAESYDRSLPDILRLQSEVAQAIASEIKLALRPREQARLLGLHPIDPDAYETYLKGRYYWNKRTEEALLKSAEYFRQAIEKNPTFALAYTGLADSQILLGDAGYGVLPPYEARVEARTAALKALEIDDTLAEAHTSLASVKEQFERDWEGAEREFKRAIELQPGYTNAHHWYAYLLAQLGRLDEAAMEIRRARELDPLSLIINADLGWVSYLARQYDKAVEQLRKTLELDQDFVRAHYLLGRTYLEKTMYDQATLEFLAATSLSERSPVYLAGLGCAYAASGKRHEAIHILNELEERSKGRYVPPYDIALIHISLGQKENAFTWLEKAFEEGSDFKDELGVGPILDPLHTDPRYRDLLRRMNLPE
jgi:TolB-like protein/Flp pilus assembly protein TadD